VVRPRDVCTPSLYVWSASLPKDAMCESNEPTSLKRGMALNNVQMMGEGGYDHP
jgi:hypothetical protein